MEYDVPRSLDVPDRLGIPFFTTVQFFILCAGIGLAVAVFNAPLYLLPFGVKAWLVVYLPVAAFLLPCTVGTSRWTVYRMIVARVGRWLRPRRAVWRPE